MRPLGIIKNMINRVLENVDHRIERRANIPLYNHLVNHLDRTRIEPVTVCDIGVADGTPWLYQAYPKAKYLLFDPTPQSLPFMEYWAKRLNADIFNVALGDRDGTVEINIRP